MATQTHLSSVHQIDSWELMKREKYAAALIVLAFFSGMVLTAATSGCDSNEAQKTVLDSNDESLNLAQATR